MDPVAYGPTLGITRRVELPRVLTADATDVDFTNLDSDVMRHISWKCHIIGSAAGASTITLQPNALSTNQRSNEIEGNGAAVTASLSATIRIGEVSASFAAAFSGEIHCIAGLMRVVEGHATRPLSAANTVQKSEGGVWEVTTKITSLRFHSSVASGFGTGSVFELFYTP